jgi:phenylpyruvate tautomerase PptA (4-oxalocrotonate tautomerase family)
VDREPKENKEKKRMPLVRISLVRGTSVDFRHTVADAVHQGLVDAFGIPLEDRFQVIEEFEPENLIVSPSYLDIPHTTAMIYVQIIAAESRTVAMKQQLYRRIVDLITQQTGHSPDDILITLVGNKAENWSFGRGDAQLVTSGDEYG